MKFGSPLSKARVLLVFGALCLGLFIYTFPFKLLGIAEGPNRFESELQSLNGKISHVVNLFQEMSARSSSRKEREHKTRLTTNTTCSQKYKMLILVTSHVGNRHRRQLIRDTWGRREDLVKYNAHIAFVVGSSRREEVVRALSNESDTYGDIVQGRVIEDFYRLAYKVEMGFEWSVLYCDYEVLLKVDDDVFVGLRHAIALYDRRDVPKEGLYMGVVHHQGPVLRDGRYGVSVDEYPEQYYRTYCAGGGFMMSRDAVERLIPHFDLEDPLIIDDAYVGVLAYKAGLCVTDRGIYFQMWEDQCYYRSGAVAQHPAKTEACMRYLYAMTQKAASKLPVHSD